MALKRHLWYTNLILITLKVLYLFFLCTFRPPGANFLTWFFDDDDDDDELHHLLTCVALTHFIYQQLTSYLKLEVTFKLCVLHFALFHVKIVNQGRARRNHSSRGDNLKEQIILLIYFSSVLHGQAVEKGTS